MRRPADWPTAAAIAVFMLALAGVWAYSLDCLRVAPCWVTRTTFGLASVVLVGWTLALIHALRRE